MAKKGNFWKRPPPKKKKPIRLPKRPDPPANYRRRDVEKKRSGGFFSRPEKKKPQQQYNTIVHVDMYKHRRVKTFKGPTARDEAKLMVSRMKYKDPNSKYSIKTERVPKRGIF